MDTLTNEKKGIALFKFLSNLSEIRQQKPTNIEKLWSLYFSSIKESDNVSLSFWDRTEDEDAGDDRVILRVHKSDFQRCPEYPPILTDWVKPDWDNYKQSDPLYTKTYRFKGKSTDAESYALALKKVNAILTDRLDRTPTEDEVINGARASGVVCEQLHENQKVFEAAEAWMLQRDLWIVNQKKIEESRALFNRLYQLYVDLNRDSDSMELVVANGFFRVKYTDINYPLLSRRLAMSFDAYDNTLCIEDTDTDSVLCDSILQNIDGLNLSSINAMMDRVKEDDLHPLDRFNTADFFKEFIHHLSSESKYIGEKDSRLTDGSKK